MSYASLEDFFHLHKAAGFLHLCFGYLFLVVLFWAGFFVTWMIYSLILWAVNTLSYNIWYLVKGSKDEQKTIKQIKPIAEITTKTESQRHLKIKDAQAKSQFPKMSFAENAETNKQVVSEFQPGEPLLTREEFARLIKDSGLTINQVAEELGISRQMASYIIHGKRNMTERISHKARELFNHFL